MNAKRSMVSVIVPVFNGEKYIKKCLNSIFRQTYSRMEVIIVNDGSTDETLKICERFKYRNDAFRIISKQNGGASSARLEGVKYAIGEYIAFVDADDWIKKDYIKRMMDELGDADIVLAGVNKVFEEENCRIHQEWNGIKAGTYLEQEELVQIYEKMLCYSVPFKFGVLPYSCNKIYRKELLTPLMLELDKKIYDGEDVAFIFPYILKSKKIVVSDYCGYNYLVHKGSVCNQKRSDAYSNDSLLYVWLYDKFMESDYSNVLIPQLDRYFLKMVWKNSPGRYLEANGFIFPYTRIKKNSNVIIYGAGDVGQAYFIQAMQSGYCEIVACADKNVDSSDIITCRFIKPEMIADISFDHVIIAISSEYISCQIFEYLIKCGIPKEKIVLC